MLISTGKVSEREPWRILEVAIGQAPDVMALRISRELKRLHAPAEALIPFTPNAAGLSEWVIEHVYVRGLNGQLRMLGATPGIDFIRKETAPAQWIATLKATESANQIGKQSFVRVLAGPCSRMCGHVSGIEGSQVTVAIQMRTKKVLVHTTLSNLQAVECPQEQQTFFYSS